MAKFKVIRAHEGDKSYAVGDIREENESVVKHLLGKCLEKMGDAPKNKAAPIVKNKASK